MSEIAVRAQLLCKHFTSFDRERPVVQMIKNIVNGGSIYKKLHGLNRLSFEIPRGAKVGLIGGNGAGKTTLLRVIAGIYQSNSGELELSQTPSCFFRFSIGAGLELSVFETITLLAAIYGISARNLSSVSEQILKMAELEEQKFTSVRVISSGQYQRLALSVFFHVQSEFVIFDEGLTYLDAKFLHQCDIFFRELSASSKTVILTSHDNQFLRRFCTTAIWLEGGSIKMTGDIDEVLDAYEEKFTVKQ